MKFLLSHNFYQQPGGEDQVYADESRLLQSHGHEVVAYTLHNDSIGALSALGAAKRTVWNSDVYRDFRTLIRREKPDVVHFQNTFPLISPAAYYAARAESVPIVQELQNYRLLCPAATFFRDGQVCEKCLGKAVPLPSVVHKCYRGSRKATAAVAAMVTTHRALGTWANAVDAYLVVTEFGRRKFIQGGLPKQKIWVKPNCVDPDPGPGDGAGGYAVFVGRLTPEKGIGTLLDAWSRLDGATPLKILGDGPMADVVKAAAGRIKGVEWLGRRSMSEVLDTVGRARFLVCPSEWYEGFPKTIVEALAKGTPVIASNLGAMAEVIDHGRTGLHFAPGDAGDLANQARRLWGDSDLLGLMRVNARRQFLSAYTAERVYKQLMMIYGSVLDRRHVAAAPVEVATLV